MRRIYAYIISLTLLLPFTGIMAQNPKTQEPPDTVNIPLSVRAGIDMVGPVIYFTNKNSLTTEAYVAADINEKKSLFLSGGYSKFAYSQYNYTFNAKGISFKAGVDFNLLKPQTSMGKYWAGVGFHYGISSFSYDIPFISYQNYWGIVSSSLPRQKGWAHYIEIAPGFRAKMFGSLSLGWSLSLKKMIYSGVSKEIGPIYYPGFGNASKSFNAGFNYYLTWNFRYKTIRVLIQKDIPEETQDENQDLQNNKAQGDNVMQP